MAPVTIKRHVAAPGSGPPPGAILESGDHAAAGLLTNRNACADTQGLGDIQAQVAAAGHIWVCGPTTAGVCVDIHCPLSQYPLTQEPMRTMC